MLKAGQGAGKYPQMPEVDATFLDLQARKTALIKQHVLGEVDAATVRAGLVEAGLAEAEFYRSSGKLADLLALNAL